MEMDLIDQYRAMHEAGHFAGHSLKQHIPEIAALVEKHEAKTLLDYGCGKGYQYAEGVHDAWGGVMPTLYDPAVPWLAERPEGRFDGVICTDVLEHLDNPESVIRDIFSFAGKFAFFSVCTRPARKKLPDGRNCHLTVKPEDWWLDLIAACAGGTPYEVAWND